jgi:hypothetical protein
MGFPMNNPADAMKQISKELQEKFDEAGMGKVEEFVDSLDDLVDKIKNGPGELMKAAEGKVAELKNKVEEIAADPSSAAPSGGILAACATTYAASVASKLGEVAAICEEGTSNLSKMAKDATAPLSQVGDTLTGALQKMEDSIKALAKLPKLVSKEIAGKDSPDDVAKINTDSMKKSLAGGDVEGPLDSIKSLSGILTSVVEIVGRIVSFLAEFIGSVAAKIKAAFDPPFPLCCLSAMAPDALKQMLEMIGKLEEIDLNPIVDTLHNAASKIADIDVDSVKQPMKAFQDSATGLVDKLEKTVQGAKMASGGGMGAMMKGF